MTRVEILDIINNIIEEEHGIRLEESNLLTDCELDSFGYAILFTSIDAEFDIVYKDYSSIDYSNFTVSKLIDNIIVYMEVSNVYKEL